jgi:SP family xylose:H+ symportor-like MFS transporter
MQNTGRNSYVFRLTLVATLGGFLFGYDTAVVSGAINAIRDFLVIPFAGNTHSSISSITGFTVSSALIGCILGGAAAGFVSLRAGRKGGMMLAAILFLISGVGAAFPENLSFMGINPLVSFIFYRIIGGVGIGLASMLSPMYIAEIAPAGIRGKLVSWNQFAIVSGILIVYFVNWFIARHGDEQWNMTTGWRYMFLSGAIPSLLFIFLLFFIPETPRFLVLKRKMNRLLRYS